MYLQNCDNVYDLVYTTWKEPDGSERVLTYGDVFHQNEVEQSIYNFEKSDCDKLLGQFGCDKASIGFSITIDRLIAALNRQNIHIPHDANGTLLVYNADKLGDAISVSKELRSTGVNVCMIEYKDSKSDSQYIEYAKESSLVNVAFIDDEYASDSTIRVIDESGKNERAAVKSLLGGTF